MTPEEFSRRVNSAISKVQKELPNIIDQNALNQKALLRDRVTQQGLNVNASGEETSFPAYSEGYEKRRAKKGLNVTPNRLVFTGDMLRKLNIVKREISDGKYTVTIGGTDQFAQDKLNYNGDQYGDILKPSSEEVNLMQQAYVDSVFEIINKELNK